MFSIWDVAGIPSNQDQRRVNRGARAGLNREATQEHPNPPQEAVEADPAVVDDRRRRVMAGLDAYRRVLSEERNQHEPALTAGQIMSRPVVTLGDTATVGEAWQKMQRTRFRHLPVINGNGQLVGMLSERDLLRSTADPDGPSRQSVRDRSVREVMRTNVFSAHPEAPIREIARVMLGEDVGAMPIFSEKWELEGIVTRGDILRVLVNHAPLELWI